MKNYQIWKHITYKDSALFAGQATENEKKFMLENMTLVESFRAPDWQSAKKHYKKWQEKHWRK